MEGHAGTNGTAIRPGRTGAGRQGPGSAPPGLRSILIRSQGADELRGLFQQGVLGWVRAAAGAVTATLALPAALLRLVARADALLAEYGGLFGDLARLLEESVEVREAFFPMLAEVAPTLHALVPALDELAPVLQEGAPMLRTLLPVLEQATPALQELAPIGNDLVPLLAEAAPGLKALVPLLDEAAPLLAELLPMATEALPFLRALVEDGGPDLAERLLRVLDHLEVDLPRIAIVGDADQGMAAVASHTDHLVELADDLISQVQALPGAGALLRRTSRRAVRVPPPPGEPVG